MKIKATVDKYCYTSKPTDSNAKKMRMRLPQEENYYFYIGFYARF